MSNAVKGFTLIELMMVLSIAAILITVAIPSFRTFTQNSKITKQINLFAATVNAARGEAAKRGVRVVICQSNDPAPDDGSQPSCSGTAKDWSRGWVVFVDDNNDKSIDADEYIVTVGEPESGIEFMASVDSAIAFNPDGSTNESDTQFSVCDSRGVDHGKTLGIAATGRPNLYDATDCTP